MCILRVAGLSYCIDIVKLKIVFFFRTPLLNYDHLPEKKKGKKPQGISHGKSEGSVFMMLKVVPKRKKEKKRRVGSGEGRRKGRGEEGRKEDRQEGKDKVCGMCSVFSARIIGSSWYHACELQ